MPAEFRLSIQDAYNAKPLPCRATLRRWVGAALRKRAEVTLRFVGRPEGRNLNHQFRGKDYATNVLTFAYPDHRPLMGDIVLCVPVARKEAAARGISLRQHCAHLVVHGTLHMQGYDHENADDARVMETLETRILRSLGYPDPYIESFD
jgi:probable rRNA maturation factor